MLKLRYLLSNVILFAAIYKHLEDSIYNFGGRTLIHDDIMEDQETNKEKTRFDVFKAWAGSMYFTFKTLGSRILPFKSGPFATGIRKSDLKRQSIQSHEVK